MTAEELRRAKWLVADAHKAASEAHRCWPVKHIGYTGCYLTGLEKSMRLLECMQSDLEKEEPDADT